MEFKEALKEILKIKGISCLEDQSSLKLLEDYGAFDEYPVFHSIMENIIAMKVGKILQNTFYYSVEDKGQAWEQMKKQLLEGLPYDKVFMDIFFKDIEYAFMGYAYEKGSYDRDINTNVEEMLGQVWTDDKGVKYSADKKRLINASGIAGTYIVNPETEYIDSYAFQQNSKIERVRLPKELKKIGSHAFQLCPYLNKIEFQDGISEIDECAFSGCALTEVKLPNGLHRVSDALFSTCTNLLYVNISKSVTSIGAHAFSDCHSLQYMVIPDNVSTIGNLAFRWCKSLYYVVLPAKLTSVGDNIFDNCKSLRYIGIPKGTKSKFTLLMPQYANLFVEFEQTKSNEKMKIIKKETLSFYQGKTNVIHYVMDDGQEFYLSQSRNFDDEANAKGACKLNTVENEKKHVLFLFNSDDKEVGRYYIGKKLQGMSPEQIVEKKDIIVFFDSWNPKNDKWIPCVVFKSSGQFASPHTSFKKEQRPPFVDPLKEETGNDAVKDEDTLKPYVDRTISIFESGNISLLQKELFQFASLLNKPGSGRLITNYPQKDRLCEVFVMCLMYDWMNDSDIREVWAENAFYCIATYFNEAQTKMDHVAAALNLFLTCCYGKNDLKPKFNDILSKALIHPRHFLIFTEKEYDGGANYLIREFSFFSATLISSLVRQKPSIIPPRLKSAYESAKTDFEFVSVRPEEIMKKMSFISVIIGSIISEV